jgi:hypothetical protein
MDCPMEYDIHYHVNTTEHVIARIPLTELHEAIETVSHLQGVVFQVAIHKGESNGTRAN